MDGHFGEKTEATALKPLASNQLLVTFPDDPLYGLSELREWADACGVCLHDLAVSALIHAVRPYLWMTDGGLRVVPAHNATYQPPLTRHPSSPSTMATLAHMRGTTSSFIALPPRGKLVKKNGAYSYRVRYTAYVFAADLGRYGIWSKVGITDRITERARDIRRSINERLNPIYLVAWWSFTSESNARRLERMAIKKLRSGCAATFPQDWFPIYPADAARAVADLATELRPRERAIGSQVAASEEQWRPMG